jgi:hypothetical protein
VIGTGGVPFSPGDRCELESDEYLIDFGVVAAVRPVVVSQPSSGQ